MKKKILLLSTACALFLTACALNSGVSSEQIGLRTAKLEKENVVLASINYDGVQAGESVLIERSFENAPPLISHSTQDMLPITRDNNTCLSCHDKAIAADVGATPIPATHYYDLRTNKKTGDMISDSRFNCDQCHVAQSDAKPLIANTFKAEFKDQSLRNKSNLIDVLNEGLK